MHLNDVFLTAISRLLPADQICNDLDLCAHYAQDWSRVLTPRAKAVVFAKNTLEVATILKCASEHRQSIVPSGGRTGLSGGAVATQNEVVLSLEKLNFIGPIHLLSQTVHVGAGAITENVHRACEPHGLTWPVDFASKGSSQVGGNISTNAGGVRVLKYGSTRNWVLGITAVTMDGTIHRLNGELEKNNTGIDLRQLLIGSEGTLAVITEATLKLCPLPRSRSVFFFALNDFNSVVRLFEFARSKIKNLSAFECLDNACFEITLKHLQLRSPFGPQVLAKVYVLIEIQNSEHASGAEGGATIEEAWMTEIFDSGLVVDGVLASSETDSQHLWKIREGIAESILFNSEVHQEDVSVPIVQLEKFYSEIQTRYQSMLPGFEIYFFGHIGDGNLHIFIRKPKSIDSIEFKKIAHNSDLKLFEILAQYQGSVSAEHGIGLLKKHALHFTRSELDIECCKKIKAIFDPKNLLNPGKIF